MLIDLFLMLLTLLTVAAFPLFVIADVCATFYQNAVESTRSAPRGEVSHQR